MDYAIFALMMSAIGYGLWLGNRILDEVVVTKRFVVAQKPVRRKKAVKKK
jgi:hypothetical protein